MKEYVLNALEFFIFVFVLGINMLWLHLFEEFANILLYLIGGVTFFYGLFYFTKEFIIKSMRKDFDKLKKRKAK